MRWKALFFMIPKDDSSDDSEENATQIPNEEKYGFKSRKCPPQIEELKPFEDDMLQLIENIRFGKTPDSFQAKLKANIHKIKSSEKMLIPADKTRNLYEVDRALHDKLLRENITKSYRTASMATVDDINAEAQAIASELKIDNRM